MRTLDEALQAVPQGVILIEEVPADDAWLAVRDRLQRATARRPLPDAVLAHGVSGTER